ncbi:hypothetical protein ACIRS1_20330 [Kitasatospora sp. NPDC101176]|uniref:hypothetical protein n=1 Tax=Kitasatospora sp. NPDC101176 TaxID=3364099 RepID=UPI0038187868
MDIDTLLHQLADEHVAYSCDRPEEFHHAGDLTVVSNLVFSCPDPSEFSECSGVPAGRHPVHVGVVRTHDTETGRETPAVTLVLVPLAAPEVIAEAEFEDAVEDYQPLGPDLGFLWDATARDAFGPGRPRPAGLADLDALVARVEAGLATPDGTGRAPAWVDLPIDETTGANLLAFPVSAEAALCLEGRDADGTLVALLFTGTM